MTDQKIRKKSMLLLIFGLALIFVGAKTFLHSYEDFDLEDELPKSSPLHESHLPRRPSESSKPKDQHRDDAPVAPIMQRAQLLWKTSFGGTTSYIQLPRSVAVKMSQVAENGVEENNLSYEQQRASISWMCLPSLDTRIKATGFNIANARSKSSTIQLTASSKVWFNFINSQGRALIRPTVSAFAFEGEGPSGRKIQFWSEPVPLMEDLAVEMPDSTPVLLVINALNLSQGIIVNITTSPGEKRIVDIDLSRLLSIQGRLIGMPKEWAMNRRVFAKGDSAFGMVTTNSLGEFSILSEKTLPNSISIFSALGTPDIVLRTPDNMEHKLNQKFGSLTKNFSTEELAAIRITGQSGAMIKSYSVNFPSQKFLADPYLQPSGLGLLKVKDLKKHDFLIIRTKQGGGIAVYDRQGIAANAVLELTLLPSKKLQIIMTGSIERSLKVSLKGEHYSTTVWSGNSSESSVSIEFPGVSPGEYHLRITADNSEIIYEDSLNIVSAGQKEIRVSIPPLKQIKGVVTNWDLFPPQSIIKIRFEHIGSAYLSNKGEFKLPVSSLDNGKESQVVFTLACGKEVRGSRVFIRPSDKELRILFPHEKVVRLNLTINLSDTEEEVVLLIRQKFRPNERPQLQSAMRQIPLDEFGRAEFLFPVSEEVGGIVKTRAKRSKIMAIFGRQPDKKLVFVRIHAGTRARSIVVKSKSTQIMFVCQFNNKALEFSFWSGRLSRGEHHLEIPSGCSALDFIDHLGQKRRVVLKEGTSGVIDEPTI